MSSECVVVFPGVFDPPTVGHIDIIRRLAALFDRVHVVIAVNADKNQPLFSVEERVLMLEKILGGLPSVSVSHYLGLVADFAVEKGAQAIVRGIREASEIDYESKIAAKNRDLGFETFFLMAREDVNKVSSTAVKEAALLGRDILHLIPLQIYEIVKNRLEEFGNAKLES